MSARQYRVDNDAARAAYETHEERLEQFYREVTRCVSDLGRYSSSLESADERQIIAQSAVGFLVAQALSVAQATNMPRLVLEQAFRTAGLATETVNAARSQKAGLS